MAETHRSSKQGCKCESKLAIAIVLHLQYTVVFVGEYISCWRTLSLASMLVENNRWLSPPLFERANSTITLCIQNVKYMWFGTHVWCQNCVRALKWTQYMLEPFAGSVCMLVSEWSTNEISELFSMMSTSCCGRKCTINLAIRGGADHTIGAKNKEKQYNKIKRVEWESSNARQQMFLKACINITITLFT